MFDLNDLAYFVKVVDHGGFAPAARALGMQKSKLSRRIAGLEQRLGERRKQGYIRECHGDLHLGNIVLEGDRLIRL